MCASLVYKDTQFIVCCKLSVQEKSFFYCPLFVPSRFFPSAYSFQKFLRIFAAL